ncbi:fimbria/pilus outer membrane usher protein [Serratia symbiotica]|nr:fimbria/pilus outer membrane usher protein [Serratia symbiotica]
MTLTQPLQQNSFVLVEAKDAKRVRLVENQPAVAIDRFGYAVMTSASPYRHNLVALALRTEDISNGLDIPMAARGKRCSADLRRDRPREV